ncbi:dihydroflavonol-4-reductase [Chryseobacterium ginsenosidimutans]|uniref:NAD-dependent epimerase/dehydratase family protein n=1 Tax=Chryseobacterium ginsenosidimutans TaxID=687846 RepID=UPI00277EAE12|nr:NAD-dependent epimerase/dehydratase family protein [Chryseobacterium ginsenosidimutans]MDQ0595078.1 dihydroflavonol-4-reductase [Chryseobacterium ginsenosidimutans]
MILVTGATGLLGRVITLELIKKGKKVRACKRSGSDLSDVRKSYHFYTPKADFFFDQIEWVDIDFNKHQSLYASLKDVEEVYHCAAKVSFDPKDSEEVLETGITSTRNLLRACMYMPVKKFLFVSSAAVLNVNKKKIELQINQNYKAYSSYVVSKYISEKMIWQAYKEGLNTVIINPGMIIGSGNWKKGNSQMLNIFVTSRFTFSGGTSCVDVRDVATVAINLMEKNIFGERFCISSENILYKDLSTRIRRMMGLEKPIVCPKILLKSLKPLRLILGMIDRKARFLIDENIEFVSERQYYNSKKIKNRIHCSFYSAAESIKFHYGNYLAYKSGKKLNENL